MKFCLFFVLLLIAKVYSYENDDKLFGIYINSPRDAELVHNFMLNNSEQVDLWQSVRINTKIFGQLKGSTFEKFKNLNVKFEIANNNITQLFEKSILEQKSKQILRQNIYLSFSTIDFIKNFNLDEYHSYQEITEYLKSIEKKFSSNMNVEMIKIGETYENREINLLKISKESFSDDKKILLIECGIHAREWVSGAGCLKIIDKLVLNQDKLANNILNNYEVHIIPILNPDGYEFTRNHKRDWRKNRSVNLPVKELCKGVDLNRNFDAAFGTVGVDSTNPCSIIYCGKEAFSEKESQALRDHAIKNKDRLHAYISLHSYSQLLLYPYGYTQNKPENNNELEKLASMAKKAIWNQQRQIYEGGNIYSAIYPASGSSLDYIALNTNSKYNYCFEMRDRGIYGFMLPEEYIEPSFKDVWIGLEQILINMKHH